ncbi:MAG TPA: tRNA (adenosine(37)-N6)-threonylcarbamoyltransferase complex ATPase subunit type 1 TsaE [Egibacteraceae bacterium]|nr:tRNA (adenosine(37)-N6)-threonylcarbamoyltransferase complex ATPase subunit type 1 TsaE [Egibacteraceae bacterium]
MTGPALRLVTESPDDTRRLGAAVAAALRLGDVVSLTGELGAGKTCLVQGAAAALGVKERVTSPSFLLRKEYDGQLRIVHIDVYRLDRLNEVEELGYEEALDDGAVAFIEWGDAMSPLLPRDHLEIELRVGESDDQRRIVVRPRGDDWLRRGPGLAVDLLRWAAPVNDEGGEV